MRRPCRVPRLVGLTFKKAKLRAERAGCQLQQAGPAVKRPIVQTIARQSPAAGRRAASLTVWLNPLCFGAALYGPTIKEPRATAGPTELVSGFFLRGGPLRQFSSRHCFRPAPPPGAGTVVVRDTTGNVVATQTSSRGRFVTIPLPPGAYTITGTFSDASVNGVQPEVTQQIMIPAGKTIRQDFFLDLP
jgi:hypothetical protein